MNYLVFELIPRYFDLDDDNSNDAIFSRKSKGLSNEIKPPRSNNNMLAPILKYIFINPPKVEFNRSCLVEDMVTHTPKTIVIFILFIK